MVAVGALRICAREGDEDTENTDPSRHFDALFHSAEDRHNARDVAQGFLAGNVNPRTLVNTVVGPHVRDFQSFTAAWEYVQVFATKITRHQAKTLCEAMLSFADVELPQAIHDLLTSPLKYRQD